MTKIILTNLIVGTYCFVNSLLREAACNSLKLWLQVSNSGSCVELIADQLIPLLLQDIWFEKETVTLIVSHENKQFLYPLLLMWKILKFNFKLNNLFFIVEFIFRQLYIFSDWYSEVKMSIQQPHYLPTYTQCDSFYVG